MIHIEVETVQITITGRNVEITSAIRNHVEERLRSKLKKFFHSIMEAHVVLMLQRFEHICEITLNVGKLTLHAHEKTSDLYVSIDKVVDKLERQLDKHRKKLQKHRTRADTGEQALHLQIDVLDGVDVDSSAERPNVIYTGEVDLKPMSVDEAVTQMDLFDQEFLVFRNSETERVNVLYRRKDGNYGLIDPK
jgi:putative sigma-54 modulation protein